MSNPQRVVGILAGGGTLPAEIAACVAARGEGVHIIAIEGEADADFAGLPFTRVTWGQIGRVLRTFREKRCTELLIVGSVKRPDLRAVIPDLGFLINLPRIIHIVRGGGDDSVLSRVIRLFEANGIRVVGPIDVVPELVVGEEALTNLQPSAHAQNDMEIGFQVIAALAPYDIGQGVIVSNARIEAIEGAEGTDAMLARLADLRRALVADRDTRPHGFLVKGPKPGQELRIDLPAIGPETITRAAAAKLEGVLVEKNRVLAAQRSRLIEIATKENIVVCGVERTPSAEKRTRKPADYTAVCMTRLMPDDRHTRDIEVAAGVIDTLSPFVSSRAAVCVRGHVRAVEAGEGVDEVLARSAGLRQWGAQNRKTLQGVVVVTDSTDVETETISLVADAGLAGIAYISYGPVQALPREIVEAAITHKVFIVALEKHFASTHAS